MADRFYIDRGTDIDRSVLDFGGAWFNLRRTLLIKALAGFAKARFLGRKTPLAVGWDVTHRCNLRCLYCGFDRLSPDELDTAGALDLIDQMAAAGTLRLHLSGGEPMVRDDIGELVAKIAGHGISCALNTNGHRVAEKIGGLKTLDAIRLSYDGPVDVHDALRGRGSYAAVLSTLQAARSNDIRVVLNATINSRNIGRIDELLEFAAQQKAPIKFQPVFSGLAYGKEIRELVPPVEQFRSVVQRLRDMKKSNRLIVNSLPNLDYYLSWPKAPQVACVAGRLYTRVDPLGRLYPCSMMMNEKLMRDARGLGFLEAFKQLPPVNCSDCICPPTLELNMLYALNLRSIVNLGRYL